MECDESVYWEVLENTEYDNNRVQANKQSYNEQKHLQTSVLKLYTTNHDIGFLLGCRLTKLQILELRENQLKMLPK